MRGRLEICMMKSYNGPVIETEWDGMLVVDGWQRNQVHSWTRSISACASPLNPLLALTLVLKITVVLSGDNNE